LSVADFVRLLQRSGEWEAKPAALQPQAEEPQTQHPPHFRAI
jgi:hypothetical protein